MPLLGPQKYHNVFQYSRVSNSALVKLDDGGGELIGANRRGLQQDHGKCECVRRGEGVHVKGVQDLEESS